MPTGYTAEVADGTVTDLRTFVLRCARAFGATIMQRDDPASDPPKHREPTDYYTKELTRERAELDRIAYDMTEDEAEAAAKADYEAELARRVEYRAEQAEKGARYLSMRAQVRTWEPPTRDHVELKTFMLKQLAESTDFDCGGTFWQDDPPRLTGTAWRTKRIADLTDSIQRHEKHEAEELERCAKANQWIDALYESFNATAVPA